MAEWTTEDGLVAFLDEWIDDLAPLNRGAFRLAARALLSRLAAHDAEVAANALEDAADDYRANLTAMTGPQAREWLGARAAAIRAEAQR